MQNLRTLALPVAMLLGALLNTFFARMAPVAPYLISVMLFVTFCSLKLSDIRFSPLVAWLLVIQVVAGPALYFSLRGLGEVYAQSAMICVFAPAAVASIVVGKMLGADGAVMAAYCVLSNFAVALLAPFLFPLVGDNSSLPFWPVFVEVMMRVMPLLVVPVIAAASLDRLWPRVHRYIAGKQIISFYIWAVALATVTGRTVNYLAQSSNGDYFTEVVVALIALAMCIGQFLAGRVVGARYGDRIAGGQSLGQKNTVLVIWMAQVWLDPVVSIAPAAYVLWQNIINSLQIWLKENRSV